MAVTRADAARLLAMAQAFDRRTVGETDVMAWADALQDLTFDECAEAVKAHYRESTDWLMVAHVRDRVKMRRAAEHERRHSAMLRDELAIEARKHDPEVSHRGYLYAMQTLAAARGWSDTTQADFEAVRAAQAVRCPWCKASPGMQCRNVDRPAHRPHPSRMELAAKQAAA